MEDPDLSTIDAAREGDHDAIADLLARVQPHVVRLVASLEHDGETVKDLTQESLLRTMRALSTFRRDSRFDTWVFAITRNVVRDHQRSRQRRPRTVHDTTVWATARHGATHDPDTALVVDLQCAIDALPRPLRAVFILVEVEGLPYAAVAELLAVAEGTVKSRMFRARRSLIETLRVPRDDDHA